MQGLRQCKNWDIIVSVHYQGQHDSNRVVCSNWLCSWTFKHMRVSNMHACIGLHALLLACYVVCVSEYGTHGLPLNRLFLLILHIVNIPALASCHTLYSLRWLQPQYAIPVYITIGLHVNQIRCAVCLVWPSIAALTLHSHTAAHVQYSSFLPSYSLPLPSTHAPPLNSCLPLHSPLHSSVLLLSFPILPISFPPICTLPLCIH